jgi:hypothetical protein
MARTCFTITAAREAKRTNAARSKAEAQRAAAKAKHYKALLDQGIVIGEKDHYDLITQRTDDN